MTTVAVACSSAINTPTPTSVPTLSSEDAVEIALSASQELYDNLASLGAVGVTVVTEPAPRTDIAQVSELFGNTDLSDRGAASVWLVEVRLSMIGAPSDFGTSYTLFAVDSRTGRRIAQSTGPTGLLTR